MKLNTASEVISFAKELEDTSIEFYKSLAEELTNESELFNGFAQENEKFKKQIERAYYSVITDAIEGGFAFSLEPDKYRFSSETKSCQELKEAVNKAMEIEEDMINFYTEAAEQSKSLMADVPRAFKMVAKKRNKRLDELKNMR